MISTNPLPPALAGPFTTRTLRDLAEALRAGRTTATALARRSLDAIAALDGHVNAFVTVDADGAISAARAADRELHAGLDRGPLHGVPVAVKDLIDVAGLPASYGSAHFRDHVATADAACVRALREAGAVIVGKTTTHEFAYGPTGDRSVNGAARNPHDPARMAGGSSGGSAAAVAAGMVPLALGTDTGGSVRIPSALCGIHGFKPAFGALPTDGVFPLAAAFDHVGVHARTAADCLTAYHALRGIGGGPEEDGGGLPRTAWLDVTGWTPTDARVTRTVRGALEARTGALPEAGLPAAAAMRRAFTALQGRQAYAVHAGRVRRAPELFDPEVLERLRAAGAVADAELARARSARRSGGRAVAELFTRFDVLALPTVPMTAPVLGAREVRLGGRRAGVRESLLALTCLWNLLGHPALTVPAGTVAGLPVGLQLVAPPGREPALFRLAGVLARGRRDTGPRPPQAGGPEGPRVPGAAPGRRSPPTVRSVAV